MNLCWITITVSDLEKSMHFYTKIMGLRIVHQFEPNPGTKITFLKDEKDNEIELIHYEGKETPTQKEGISLGFETENLEDTIAFLKENGITHMIGPIRTPAVTFIFIKDPDGVTIQFAQNLK